jgi:hypothetical protein
MQRRVLAVGIGLAVAGAFLLVAPIASTPYSVTHVVPGSWFELTVPRAASWTGAAVGVQIGWGTPLPPCAGSGVDCEIPYEPAFLMVYDCGEDTCSPVGNGSYVGTSETATNGSTGFMAIPGHNYQVWVWIASNSSDHGPVPVTYSLETPVLDGGFGAGLIGGGALVAALAFRTPVAPADRRVT